MDDLRKVIKGLECAIGVRGCRNCDECPYDNDFNCIGCEIVMSDALELLKASRQTEWERDTAVDQLTQIGKSIGEQMNDIVLLLEKQRVSRGRWERLTGMAPPEYHGHKVCSVCGCMAPHHPIHIAREELPKYCPGCGAEMEGEER